MLTEMKLYKHNNWNNFLLFLMLISFCSLSQGQNNSLVLNGAITVLNGGSVGTPIYIVVNQPNTAGISRLGGHIHSENQYNFVKWISGTGTGNYVFPFGVGANTADYIPFTFNKTTATNSNVDMSTWQTNVQNMPHAAATNVGAVTSMTGTADSVVSALDRFWDIQTSAATTADLTFSYLGIENTTASPTDTVKAQHWNGTSWDAQVGPGNLGVVAGVGTAGPFIGQSTFSPWILSIFSPCPTAIIAYPANYCDNDTSTIPVIFSGGLGGTYSATPTGLSINSTTGAILPSNSNPGTYTVTYTLDSTLTCPVYTTTTTVTIHPTYLISQSLSFCEGDSVLYNGVHQTAPGVFTDSLTSSSGCDSIVVTTISIELIGCEPSFILIPNVFTPNGDGFNDIFTVDGVGLESVEGEIFNRWGQKMFSWDNIKGGWDGRTLSGNEAPDGTYFFLISALGEDGTEYFEKGSVSLIR